MVNLPRGCRALLVAGAMAGAVIAPVRAGAQEAAADADVVVSGQREPPAEAPRSATCEALVRDGLFRALLNETAGGAVLAPQILLPTRVPRNPDWNAAPLSPPGSPLPELGETRFGVTQTDFGGEQTGAALSLTDFEPDPNGSVASNRDQAIRLCRATYERGSSGPSYPSDTSGNGGIMLTGPGGITWPGRTMLVQRDETLPMAFALFDQGRYQEALDWFRRAEHRLPLADGGEEAALFIGKINLLAPGGWADREEGIRWLKWTAESPFNPMRDLPRFDPAQPERNSAIGEAAIILGNLYRTGFGEIAPDPKAARCWFDRALDVGHLPAAQVLGDMSFAGEGTKRDPRRAMRYYRQVAGYGLPSAQYALAQILEFGDDGVSRDLEEALRWYREAARARHPGALFALAVAYDKGQGVPADRTLATGFYKEAALQGHAGAMAALGTSFYTGDGVPQDHAAARQWFAQAAGQGDTDGMVNLAVMSARGEGGSPDRVAAWQLLDAATRLQHGRAPQVLAALEAQMSWEERRLAEAGSMR